jgi:outer membrane protein assembly factor BamA
LFLLSFAFAETQKPSSKNLPPSGFTLRSVKVIGTSRYKPADVMRAAKLQLGRPLHDGDLNATVRLLGESGAFAAVSYGTQFDADGAKITLRLRDAERFFPAHFDNVVWFSDQELLKKLHAIVPLFDGELPVNGELASEVSHALERLLIQKNVAGQVGYLRPSDEDNPVDAFVFSVRGPNITIREVRFSGVGPDELPKFTATAKQLQGKEYTRPAIRLIEDKAFLPVYREHGYLKAILGDPEPAVVETGAHDILVDVTLPVRPGRQYKLAKIEISGNNDFPDATLQNAFHIHAGDVANSVELNKDLEAVHEILGTRGYMDAAVKGELKADDVQSSATYLVSIVEGDVYKMGKVEFQALSLETTTRLRNEWTLRSGDTYDASYVGRFVEQTSKLVGNWQAHVHESIDPRDKTVDVTIRFAPAPEIPAFDGRGTEY